MKKIGIIAEYNPFHNGHLYQIQKTKEELNPDLIIVVMSQDVTQRGEFASFNKWWRTQKALEAGADLVIGLPFYVSSQSAEYFAEGSIRILNKLGIDTLVFGSENNEIESLEKASDVLVQNEKVLVEKTKNYLKEGYNFPRSRELALKDLGIVDNSLFKPNNILALEYLKAIKKNNFSIKPFLIERKGSGYHDLKLDNNMASASGLRKALKDNLKINEKLPYSETELRNNYKNFDKDAFFKSLLVKLINSTAEDLEKIVGINQDRANQLLKLKGNVKSLDDIYNKLKSKNITQTALNRMILNILMDFKKTDLIHFFSNDFIPYIRVLGFNQKGQEILRNLKVPTITTFNKGLKRLNESQLNSVKYDLKAAQLRSIFLDIEEFNSDYLRKIIKQND